DGTGMSRDDALLSLERHATSKIRRAEDLAAIATMGFRGEALPSIASVSRFTLTTREREGGSPEATQIVINGGKILEVKAAGSAPGTSVEVRQIFFNLPARRKFLRSEETESAHIQHYLTLAALAYPEVAFTFSKDGRLIWQLPAINSGPDAAARLSALRERLRAIQGGEQRLLAVDFSVELAEPAGAEEFEPAESSIFRVWGFMGAPGVSRSTREDQHLFVNRRPVENRGLNFALLEGYHTALMKGRYPVCCLFLEIDPAGVDVNIHPSKREVKFHQEGQVRRHVAQAVRQALLKFHGGASPEHASATAPTEARSITGAAIPRPAPEQIPSTAELPHFTPARPIAPPIEPRRDVPLWQPKPLPESPRSTPVAPAPVPSPSPATPSPTRPVPLLNVPLRLVGVVGRLYVVLESDRGLVLLDQHAAHERILFEQMLNRLEQQGNAASQKL